MECIDSKTGIYDQWSKTFVIKRILTFHIKRHMRKKVKKCRVMYSKVFFTSCRLTTYDTTQEKVRSYICVQWDFLTLKLNNTNPLGSWCSMIGVRVYHWTNIILVFISLLIIYLASLHNVDDVIISVPFSCIFFFM